MSLVDQKLSNGVFISTVRPSQQKLGSRLTKLTVFRALRTPFVHPNNTSHGASLVGVARCSDCQREAILGQGDGISPSRHFLRLGALECVTYFLPVTIKKVIDAGHTDVGTLEKVVGATGVFFVVAHGTNGHGAAIRCESNRGAKGVLWVCTLEGTSEWVPLECLAVKGKDPDPANRFPQCLANRHGPTVKG